DVIAVSPELHPAGPLQRLQPLDRRRQLHAVVGGERLAARQFLLARARANDDAPAARPRIALAGAVREHLDVGEVGAHAASRPAGSLNTIRSSTPSTGSSVTAKRSASA